MSDEMVIRQFDHYSLDELLQMRRLVEECESEPEVFLFVAWVIISSNRSMWLVPQHIVGKYRIDFVIPRIRFGIEVDGIEFHGNQAAFMHDRRRTRDLNALGWEIVRFTAKEVNDNPRRVAYEIMELATLYMQKTVTVSEVAHD